MTTFSCSCSSFKLGGACCRHVAFVVAWLCISALGGCITYLDSRSEVVDSEIGDVESVSWKTGAGGDRERVSEWISPRDGFYRVHGDGASNVTWWSGRTQLSRQDPAIWTPLRAGDRLRAPDGASPLNLTIEAALDRSWRPAGRAERLVTVSEEEGGYSLDLSESIPIATTRRLVRRELVPDSYRIGGTSWSPDEVDRAQMISWILFPPLEVGRLLTRIFGGRLIKEPDWAVVESPAGERELVGAEATAIATFGSGTWKTSVDRLVQEAKLAAELTFSEANEIEKTISWDIVYSSSSNMIKLPSEFREVVESRLDFGRYGRLSITSRSGGGSVEETIDLIRLLGL